MHVTFDNFKQLLTMLELFQTFHTSYCVASVESLHLGCAYNCVDTIAKSRATTKSQNHEGTDPFTLSENM